MQTKHIATAEVKAVETEDPNGAFEVILSTPELDRDGEVVDAKAFGSLPDHITFDIDHGLSTATTVGSGSPSYDTQGNLVVKGSFSSIPRAQEVRTLVNEGHIRNVSVAYMTMPGGTKTVDGVRHIVKAELLNGAFVPVPANRGAMVLSSKTGARNSSTDSERLQQIHDLAVENGATCPDYAKAAHGAETKSIVGTLEALQDRVRDALEDEYGEYNTWLRGVDPDKGIVYFNTYDQDNSETRQQSFTDDGAVITLTGDAVEVDVQEVVVPDADADREGDEPVIETNSASNPDTQQDTTGAVGKSVEDADLEMQARRKALALASFIAT